MRRKRKSEQQIKARHALILVMVQFGELRAAGHYWEGRTLNGERLSGCAFEAGKILGMANLLYESGAISSAEWNFAKDFVFESCKDGWMW